VIPRFWFIGVTLVETFRKNLQIRRAERADTRVLEGDELVKVIEQAWR
jgi:hypothetical protein